jgi:hypothetical protein
MLAFCAASVCASMLCCKVCENSCALAESAGELPGVLFDEPNSELIYESGDMVNPVYPVNPVKFRLPRSSCHAGLRVMHPQRAS